MDEAHPVDMGGLRNSFVIAFVASGDGIRGLLTFVIVSTSRCWISFPDGNVNVLCVGGEHVRFVHDANGMQSSLYEMTFLSRDRMVWRCDFSPLSTFISIRSQRRLSGEVRRKQLVPTFPDE